MAKEMNLQNLFHDTLKDVYYAERKALKSYPKMIRAAQGEELKQAFRTHAEQTQGQIERLQQIFELMGKPARGKTCDAMDGIISEAEDIIEEYEGSDALDAGLISSAQAVEHYEITRYGTLKRWAQELGLNEAVTLLDDSLKEESQTDAMLTKIADGSSNKKAKGQKAA